MDNLSLAADACALPDFYNRHLGVPTKLLFFQCPWYTRVSNQPYDSRGTAKLLINFIKSAYRAQRQGDYLVIGLCTSDYYIPHAYEWDNAISKAEEVGYQLLQFGDADVENACYDMGYHHPSSVAGKDIEWSVRANNGAWVFQKL